MKWDEIKWGEEENILESERSLRMLISFKKHQTSRAGRLILIIFGEIRRRDHYRNRKYLKYDEYFLEKLLLKVYRTKGVTIRIFYQG